MNIQELVKQTNGKFFKVTFTKADGSIRNMVCRTKVTKHLKGGERKAPKDAIVVFDVQKKEYRCFKPETVISFQCGKNKLDK